jgi:pimeloyl-ACP methyl ester carboxylesterase
MAKMTAESFNDGWWTVMRSRHRFGDEQIRFIAGLLNVLAADTTDVAFSRDQLSAIEPRTLLVFGDRDWCFPAPLAVELYEALPDALLWVVPGGGHVPITGENAARFTETALEFLAGD